MFDPRTKEVYGMETASITIGYGRLYIPIRYAIGDEKFLRPTSMPELFSFIAEYPNARLIAGATELGLELSKRFKKFPALISLEAVPDLTQIGKSQKEWRVGGAATLTAV